MAESPHFCLVDACNFQITGMGVRRTNTSVITSVVPYANSSSAVLKQYFWIVFLLVHHASILVPHWKAVAKKNAVAQHPMKIHRPRV